MKQFLSGLLHATLAGVLSSGAIVPPGSDLKTTSTAAAVGALAGLLQFIIQHPATNTNQLVEVKQVAKVTVMNHPAIANEDPVIV